jgi:hypothetical protein
MAIRARKNDAVGWCRTWVRTNVLTEVFARQAVLEAKGARAHELEARAHGLGMEVRR